MELMVLLYSILTFVLLVLCLTAIVVLFPKAQRKHIITIFLFIFSIRIFTLFTTTYNQKTHDVEGHIQYISYLYQHLQIPQASDCWECYHPPLYYLSALPFYIFDLYYFKGSNYVFLQSYSLLLSLLTVIVAFRIITHLITNRRLQTSAMLILGFVPALVFSSVRIGNDSLVLLISVVFLYYYLCSPHQSTLRQSISGIIWIFLGLLTKSNAIILVPLWIFHFQQNKIWMHRGVQNLIISTIPLFLVTLLIATRGMFFDNPSDLLVGNISNLNSGLMVRNDPVNFLWFDLKDYLTYPSMNPWSDEGGRQYFHNYAIKSALIGEFPFSIPLAKWSSSILLLLVLYLLASTLINYFKGGLGRHYTNVFLLFYLFLAIFRYLKPFASSTDFRYIAAAYVPLILSIVTSNSKNKLLVPSAISFSIFSVIFIISTCLIPGQ